MSVFDMLQAVGITRGDIDKAVSEVFVVRQAIIDKAEEVETYWKSIAPVRSGDYRDSIHIEYDEKKTGFLKARVVTKDWKAHWLEYGSIHNPEYGFAAKTVEEFGGKKVDQGTGANYVVA